MAALSANPSGFSYAQAARGRSSASTATASKPPSSKVTSGAATPATGTLSDATAGSSWADDVEANIGSKAHGGSKTEQDRGKDSKETVTDRTKVEMKLQNGTPAISPQDPAASSSTTTKEDDSSSAPNGSSSETTWDTKSHTSDPAWITERKERQNSSQVSEGTVTTEKKADDTETAIQAKPVILQEAPPPTVNPWARRAEEARAKMAAALPRPVVTASTSEASTPKENQRPAAEARRKPNSLPNTPQESSPSTSDDSRRPGGIAGKRTGDVRTKTTRHNSKAAAGVSRPGPSPDAAKAGASEHRSSPNLSSVPPPSVKDEVAWPTPDTIQEKERKDSAEKELEERNDEDATPATKRKKPEWKVMPVVPTVIWETPSMNESKERRRGLPGGDRGNRGGGNGTRGRGGYRGAPNGVNGSDRSHTRVPQASAAQDAEPSAAMPDRLDTADLEPAIPLSSPASRQGQKFDPATSSNPNREPSGAHGAETTLNGSAKSFLEMRQLGSANTASGADARDEDILPKPIPRRSPAANQSGDFVEGPESAARDGPVRMGASDGRKDSRAYDNFRDSSWNSTPRGNKRGGRGRGGTYPRELTNGHPASHTYGNSFTAEVPATSPYGVPPSPSAYSASRANHQFTYPAPSRGSWSRGNPRSQSIPVDHYYARYGGQFAAGQSPIPTMQPYIPGMYDFHGYPMTAMPFTPVLDQHYLWDMVSTQLEYYFSIDNLLKDMFLRQNMDSQGFVFLDVVANFNRLKQLTQDKDLIKAVCLGSKSIEIRVGEDGKDRLRKADGWDQFLLPADSRAQSAQTDGPKELHPPEKPQLQFYGPMPSPYRGPASAGLPSMHHRGDRNASYPTMNGFAPQFAPYGFFPEGMYSGQPNGEETRGRPGRSPIGDSSVSPSQHLSVSVGEEKDVEPDVFPDDQASVLTVVVKVNGQQRLPHHNAASRTFSNGSIDAKNLATEVERLTDNQGQSTTNGERTLNGTEKSRSVSRHASPNSAPSQDSDMQLFWVKDQEGPVDNLPSSLTSEPYVQLRFKALDQRNHAATGTCPYDLDVLYQFWCHFLLRNFNNRMYSEFKYYANEDAKDRHSLTGLQNLLKFYTQALNSVSPIRDRVVKDYVDLVKNEPAKLERSAFKQLRSSWRNGALNLKNRKKLADIVDETLKQQLDKLDA